MLKKGSVVFSIMLVMILSLNCITTPANAAEGFPTWNDLQVDWVDTDSDGNDDNFASYNTGDTFSIVDTIHNFTDYSSLSISIIYLESDTTESMMFFNVIGSVFKIGDEIKIEIEIIEDSGGNETYDVLSIIEYVAPSANTNVGSVVDDDDEDAPWYETAGVCGVFIVIVIVVLVIKSMIRKGARKVMKSEPDKPEVPKANCTKCGKPARFVAQYSRMYCDTCKEYLPKEIE